jgi:hypothetical protein
MAEVTTASRVQIVSRARRAVEHPGTYGATRSANGRRRNQRTWLSSNVDPAKSASAATPNSRVWFTPSPRHADS